jgi:DNA-binding transcriptional MerR regulator/methylmalonyl-CoA mutase cobalamin-binding subunit
VKKTTPDRQGHPIQVVARRTGLTPEVLRVWEKRYGVVTPSRAANGRRLYSSQDIERLSLLRQATLGGRRIGEISGLGTEELRSLLNEDIQAETASARREEETSPVARFRTEALAAVKALDGAGLHRIFLRSMLALGSLAFVEDLLAPFFAEVGERWERGDLDPYQEHLATSTVKLVLNQVMVSRSDARAPVLVITTPPGQRHEIGAMLAAIVAIGDDWKVLYLGAELPADDIVKAVRQAKAQAVALSLVYPEGDRAVAAELEALAKRRPKGLPLILGGKAAPSYAKRLAKTGAYFVEDLKAFRAVLGRTAAAPA